MIPILFAPGTTDFSTNGIGRLSEAITCIVKEQLNGIYELEMTYPITGQWFSEIKHSCFVYALNYDGGSNQAFRIYEITKPSNGRITVYGEHLSYQTNWIPVEAFEASSLQDCLTKLKSKSAESNPFTITTDKSVMSAISFLKPKSLRAMLGGEEGSILQTYKGEYVWDNYSIKLLNKRGTNNGVTLRYGKNITTIEQELNIENTYTGVYPYWYSEDTGILVTLPEKVVHSSTSSNFPYQRTAVVDFSDKFDDPPQVYQLRNITDSYIKENNIGHPNVSINVQFIQLWQSTEYSLIAPLERVKLGDTVTVIFEKLGIEEQAEIIEYEFDVLKERYNSIQIGDPKSNLSQTIAQINSTMELNVEKSKEYATKATYWLTKGDGYLYIIRGDDGSWRELIAMDTPNYKTAKHVLRLNQYGIGFSDRGVDGPYYQAWTLDGVMTLGGLNNAYGQLKLLNPSGQTVGLFTKDGIKFTNGGVITESDSDGLEITSGQATAASFTSTNGIEFLSNNKKTLTLTYQGLKIFDNSNERLTAHYSQTGVFFYNPSKSTQEPTAAFDTAGVRLYNNNKLASQFTASDVTIYENGYEVAKFSGDGVALSKRGTLAALFNSSGSYFYTTNNRLLGSYDTSGIILYSTAGKEVIRVDANGLKISNNGIVVANFNTTGINLYRNGTLIAAYTNTGNTIYDTSGNIVAQFDSNGLKTYRSGNLVSDITDGVRLYGRYNNNQTVLAKFEVNGNIIYDRNGNEAIKINTDGIYLNKNGNPVATFNSDGLKLYRNGNRTAEFLNNGLYLYNASNDNYRATFDSNGCIIYDNDGNQTSTFDKTGVTFYNGGTMIGDISKSGVFLYDTNGQKTSEFSKTKIEFYNAGTTLGTISKSEVSFCDSDGNKTSEFTKSGITFYNGGVKVTAISKNGIYFYDSDGNTKAEFTSSTIGFYTGGKALSTISKSGVLFYDGNNVKTAEITPSNIGFYSGGKTLSTINKNGILFYDGNDIKLADISKSGISFYDNNGYETFKVDKDGLKISSNNQILAQYLRSGITLYNSTYPTITMSRSSVEIASYASNGTVNSKSTFDQNGVVISKTSGGKTVSITNESIQVSSQNSDGTTNLIKIGYDWIENYHKKSGNNYESRMILGYENNDQFIEMESANGVVQMSTRQGFFINDSNDKTVAALYKDRIFVNGNVGVTEPSGRNKYIEVLTGINLEIDDVEFTMSYDTLFLKFVGGLCVYASDESD